MVGIFGIHIKLTGAISIADGSILFAYATVIHTKLHRLDIRGNVVQEIEAKLRVTINILREHERVIWLTLSMYLSYYNNHVLEI